MTEIEMTVSQANDGQGGRHRERERQLCNRRDLDKVLTSISSYISKIFKQKELSNESAD